MTTPYPRLFSPGRIGSIELRNRIVQSPMGTGLIDLGQVTAREIAFQEERARAGVGLIVTGGAAVHTTSRFPARIILETWDEVGIDAMRRRCEAVHRHGTKIFGQLIHLGRESPGGLTDYVPMGPSPVPHLRDPGIPHEMSLADIRMVVDAFATSAANYKAAGYDGVEIHAAHGYLVSQFLSPESNYRRDGYGGAVDGRIRLLVEIVEEIRDRCGAGFPVGARLSAEDYVQGGLTLDGTREIALALQDVAPVEYVSITTGMRGNYVKDSSYGEGFALDMAEAVRADLDVPVIVAGRIRYPELAERALVEGKADFIAIGRAQLADPDWVEKAREGRSDQIRPCVGIVQDCRRPEGIVACTVHARTGREAEWGAPRRAAARRRIVVAGAGPGGLEAARVAAESGHEVILYERNETLGGQLRIAAAGPTREELLDYVLYLEREVRRLGVEVRVGSEATPASVLERAPDLVVCAAGATPEPPAFPISGEARVVTVWDLLDGKVEGVGGRVLVVDDGAGFWHGISAAEYAAERAATVELVTPARGVALAIPHESIANVLRRLGANAVRARVLTSVVRVDGPTVFLTVGFAHEPMETTADLVVVRTAMRANDDLVRALEGEGPALALVGDASAPRRLNHAVLDANLAVRRFDEGRLGRAAVALA